MSAYVDMLENKLDQMTHELVEMCKELREMKKALNKVSEFFGVKKKLEKIRDKVREGIVETDITLARIDGFTEGVHVANQ